MEPMSHDEPVILTIYSTHLSFPLFEVQLGQWLRSFQNLSALPCQFVGSSIWLFPSPSTCHVMSKARGVTWEYLQHWWLPLSHDHVAVGQYEVSQTRISQRPNNPLRIPNVYQRYGNLTRGNFCVARGPWHDPNHPSSRGSWLRSKPPATPSAVAALRCFAPLALVAASLLRRCPWRATSHSTSGTTNPSAANIWHLAYQGN